MRSKHIIGLIIFIATFAFSSFIALLFVVPKVYEVPPVATYEAPKCSETSRKIENLLNRDKRYGLERRNYDSRDEAGAIREYADKSGSMDASDLPRDFQSAWNEHMLAWNRYAGYMEWMKTRNEFGSDEFYERQSSYIDDINTTWAETLRVGRKHGANLPDGF